MQSFSPRAGTPREIRSVACFLAVLLSAHSAERSILPGTAAQQLAQKVLEAAQSLVSKIDPEQRGTMDDKMGNAEMRSAIQPLALQIMFTCFGAALLARFWMRERSRPAEAEEDRRAEVTDVSNVRREIMAIHLKHIIDGVAFLDVLFTLNSRDYTRFLRQPYDIEWTALETPTGTGIPSSGLSFRVREAPHVTWWEVHKDGMVTYRTLVPPTLLDSALNQGSPGLHLLLESASRALNWEGRVIVGEEVRYDGMFDFSMGTTRFDDHGDYKSRACLHQLIISFQPGFSLIALRWLAEGGLRNMIEHCNADHWPHDLLTEQLALLLINAFFPRNRDATIEMGLDEQFRDVLPRAEIEFSCAP